MLKDISKFCVEGNCVFNVDTTFDLFPGLWLTDTSYACLALINKENKHPQCPGPSMWHFRKDTAEFRTFALELVTALPELINIKIIGHDLDKATAVGFKSVFTSSKHLWCTQHLQQRTSEKLKTLGVDKRGQNKIMADLYGCQLEYLEETGLADAEDEEDFEAKLQSFKEIWEEIAPGFCTWFQKFQGPVFKSCLVLHAQQELGIDGRYDNNGLELKHKQQKKKLNELVGKTTDVEKCSSVLNKWIEENYMNEVSLAIRGLGKYRLASGYEQFLVAPHVWARMTQESRDLKISELMNFTVKPSSLFKKPVDAGKKCAPPQKRRANQIVPELFIDRTPLVSKIARTSEVDLNPDPNPAAFDPFNPDRKTTKSFTLVLKNDHKKCPKGVKRCESCKIQFDFRDTIVVKTTGLRPYTKNKQTFH